MFGIVSMTMTAEGFIVFVNSAFSRLQTCQFEESTPEDKKFEEPPGSPSARKGQHLAAGALGQGVGAVVQEDLSQALHSTM